MITAGTGLATGDDLERCAETAASQAMEQLAATGGRAPDALLAFTSGELAGDGPRLLRALRSVCGTGTLAGCSGAGILTESGEIEGDKGVAVLALSSDSLRATPFFVRGLKGRDRDVGREIGKLVEPHLDQNAMLVLFPDTLSCNPDQLFGGIHDVAGPVPVVGGGAASGSADTSSVFQFCGGESLSNAVSGMILSGGIVCSVGVTQSCLPVGRPRRVTGAVGNAIKSLDGVPAVQALLESLAGPGREISEDLHRLAHHLFVAYPPSPGLELRRGQYVVRNILGVDPDDGAIFVGQETAEGETISFALRDPDGAREDLKAMLEENLLIAGQPDLGFYFNCCARGRGLYGLGDIDTAYIRNAFSGLPLVGFFGYAEIASLRGRTRLHNYSGVMVLVSEAPVGPSAGLPA